MSALVEQAAIFLVKQLLTPAFIKQAEVQFVAMLKDLAAKTDNKVDDAVVQIISDALGIQA